MAMFWMLTALISLDFKSRVVENATEKDSKHDQKYEILRNGTKIGTFQPRRKDNWKV